MEITFSLENIHDAVKAVLAENPSKVILFHGEMGAGKTTFIKALASELGVSGATSSPTFSLVNQYLSDDGKTLYHFDMYRIKGESEALDMGIDEYLYSGDWCLIEWAENIPNLIPQEHSVISIRNSDDGLRHLALSSYGK